ncbi:MAG: hypothetical protein LBQ22_00070 [Bacteroidales bacterium]|jgi:hypothetical protein|nr:hypothetical protein [Bacteroidales bacterium]
MKKLFLLFAACGLIFAASCNKEKDCNCKYDVYVDGEIIEMPAEYESVYGSYDITIDGKDIKNCDDMNTTTPVLTYEFKLACSEK